MALSLLLTVILAIQSTGQAKTPRPVISVTLSSVSSVKLGSEVRLKIVVTNTSDHELGLRRSSGKDEGEFLNRVEVHDEQGNAPMKTKYYRTLRGERIGNEAQEEINGGFVKSTMKPGESVTEEVILNKLFEIDKPGKYIIQVEQGDPEIKVPIKSNTVTVTLTP